VTKDKDESYTPARDNGGRRRLEPQAGSRGSGFMSPPPRLGFRGSEFENLLPAGALCPEFVSNGGRQTERWLTARQG
jgi:hypothetical protein